MSTASQELSPEPGRWTDTAATIALPFLAALVIPLGQLAANVQLLSSLRIVWWAVGLAAVVAICADVLARLCIWRRWNRPLVATVFVVSIFGYGHMGLLFTQVVRINSQMFLILWIGFCIWLGFTLRTIQPAQARLACRAGAMICTIVLSMQVFGIIAGYSPRTPPPKAVAALTESIRPRTAAELPDVYYIILDAYARQDVLQAMYSFDNSPFIDALRQRGFQVSNQSRSNYPHTRLSLASSLNLDYVDQLMKIDPKSRATGPLADMIQSSRVDGYLRKAGYRTVSFASGYSYTERLDSDEYIHLSFLDSLSESHLALLRSTLAWPLVKRRTRQLHEDRVRGAFAGLADVAGRSDKPRFIFAHIVCPHAPFVFNAEGKAVWFTRDTTDGDALVGTGPNQVSREVYREYYRQQLQFVNGQVLSTIDTILKKSAKPPLIILQSDHGPASEFCLNSAENTNAYERLSNFHAAYVPPGCGIRFSDDHSTVNTFRIVLNELCGTKFEMLSTRCYYAYWSRPLELVELTARTLSPAALPLDRKNVAGVASGPPELEFSDRP